MTYPNHLPLHELLFCCNFDIIKNKRIYATYEAKYQYGVAGLLLFELLLERHIDWHDKTTLRAIATHPPSAPLLLEVWELCSQPNRINWFWWKGSMQDIAVSPKDWLQVTAFKTRKPFQQIERSLLQKNILTTKYETIMGVFSQEKLIIKEPQWLTTYKNHLVEVVTQRKAFEVKDFIMLKVVQVCHLTDIIFKTPVQQTRKQFEEQLLLFTTQSIEDEELVRWLAQVELHRDLEDLVEVLENLTDVFDGITDAMGDAAGGGDGGGDGGDGGGGD